LYGYVVNLKKVNEMLLDDIFSNQKLIGVIKPGGSEKIYLRQDMKGQFIWKKDKNDWQKDT